MVAVVEPSFEQIVKSEVYHCANSIPNISAADVDFIVDLVTIKTFKKGTILLNEGEVPSASFHNYRGCVRQYYLKDGLEKTTFFYLEEDSISCSSAAQFQTPSNYYLECLEDTTMGIITHEKEKAMYQRFPMFESSCRLDTEMRLNKFQELLAFYIISSPEERYLNILNHQPELVHRVPQYQLASYLGIQPESLSRIRKRILQKREEYH